MNYLYDALTKYQQSNTYPFHMPGHKRQGMEFVNPFLIDITEIKDFDNLHHAEGIIQEAQQRAASLYGAEQTYFLINGSTAGILSAISAAVSRGGTILMARNCHKAAYHGAFLRQLNITYLYPEAELKYGINGGITAQQVTAELERNPEIQAVFLTSPTFDGVVSDLKKIVVAAHHFSVPVIVDEAHGVHFGFNSYFPENAVSAGADIVIHSLHKTLPALTQTALLHVGGKLVRWEELQRYLSIYQTSSPSYVLMASIDECIRKIAAEGSQLFVAYTDRLKRFYNEAASLKHLRVTTRSIVGQSGIFDLDPSKLIISSAGAGLDGSQLQQKLRQDWGLELEMAAGNYALALTSVMDTDQGFECLLTALRQIDQEAEGASDCHVPSAIVTKCEQYCSLHEADEAEQEVIKLINSKGRIAAEFLYLYPPGVPLIVPGERITEQLLGDIEEYQKRKFSLQGPADHTIGTIRVLKQ